MQSYYPSQIIEYLYCPRYTFFEYVLCIPQYEEKFYKVNKGREIHNLKLEQNKDYLRKKIGAQNKWLDQYLGIPGLRGKIDEVLQLQNNTYAPLDYKFALWNDKVYETYKQQLSCYAVLIEENFKGPVNKGFLIYTRSKNKIIEVEISQKDKEVIKKSMLNMSEIIENNRYPKATSYKKRCVNCTYRNICTK
jgi:CRISPR-associated exonuclease Cas4